MSRITAGSIRSAMSKRWAAPEYALMWEVGEGTGAASGRYADAIIMSLWPSRGLEVHGVEIKVSRADWRREAADPTKAEAIARYCDRWYVHTAPGVVPDVSELPPAWGLREYSGRGWRTIREAEKTEAAPITRNFLAAMLRRADGTTRLLEREAEERGRAEIHAEREKMRADYAKSLDDAVKRRTSELERNAERLAEFEAAFGRMEWGVDFAALGKAARTLHDCRPNGYGPLVKRLRAAADEIDAIEAMVRQPETPA